MRTRIDLVDHFNDLGFRKGAEIVVADVRYSEILCQKIPDLTLHCVDPWQKYGENQRGGPQAKHDENFKTAKDRLKKYDVNFMKMLSMDAVNSFPYLSLDFVFIDGHHDFDFVMMDLIEWSKRVRKGGIVAGHDYYNFDRSGVIEAVDCYTKAHNIKLNIIPKNRGGHRDDRPPCFWWVR